MSVQIFFKLSILALVPQFLRVVDIVWLLAHCGICCEYFFPVFQFSLDFANLLKIFRFFFNLHKFINLLLPPGFNSYLENLFLIHAQTGIHSCFLLVLMWFHFYIRILNSFGVYFVAYYEICTFPNGYPVVPASFIKSLSLLQWFEMPLLTCAKFQTFFVHRTPFSVLFTYLCDSTTHFNY